jgi:aminoglycoside N3'-acetyltransferase
MERRHIREGEARVARQEEIVSQLDSIGAHHEHVLTAHALLATFRQFVASAKQHLEDLEREHLDTPH